MKYNKILLLILTPFLFFPSLVDAKEYVLSNGIEFEGNTEEYEIAEMIIEESLLPLREIYIKSFEAVNKKKKYKIFNIKDVIKEAEYTGNAGYDKKNKVFYLDSKNGKSEILLTINHPFSKESTRVSFLKEFTKEINKNIKKKLKRERLDFRKIDIKEGTDLYYLANYYALVSLVLSYEDTELFYKMFLYDIRIDQGKVKNKCANTNHCAHYIIASTEKESLKINEESVNQFLYGDLLPNDIQWPQSAFKIKKIFFVNPSAITKPVYVYMATDQTLLSPFNDRIEISIKDIRFLSDLSSVEAGL